MEPNNINTFIKKEAEKKNAVLLIFSTLSCKWCHRLKEILKNDPHLELYAKANSITIKWVKLPPKQEDEKKAQELGGRSYRETYGIKSLPTLALFDHSGRLLETTEYLDEADNAFGFEKGTQAYIDWVSPILFPSTKTKELEKNNKGG